MHRHLSLTLAALLALSPGAAAAAVGGKSDSQDRPEHRRAFDRQSAETERDTDRVPALFRELSPHRAARLEKMRKENPDRFRRILRGMGRKIRELERLRRKDAEEFNRRTSIMRLEDSAARIADELRRAADSEAKSRFQWELQTVLEKLFDKKEDAQRARLKRMEKDLQELKERLDDRRRRRKELIEKRMEELEKAEPGEF